MKKSQITVFIIVGLVIIASSIIIWYLRSQIINEMGPKIDDVSEEYRELQEFVLECTQITGEQALTIVGEHGGYIDPMDPDTTGKLMKMHPMPTESEILMLSQDYAIPYWWHMSSPQNCQKCIVSDNNMPSLEYIQAQVSRYVETHIAGCLRDFKAFKEQGFKIQETGEPEAVTIVNTDDVLLYVYYPIDVTIANKEIHMENFPVNIELDFLDIYIYALSIAKSEQEYQYLESMLMHLISTYSAVDASKLPPIADYTEGKQTVTWNTQNVRPKLQSLLKSNIPLIQIKDINSTEITPFTLFSNESFDLDANFIFLDWPIYLDITPSKGNKLQPSTYRREFPYDVVSDVQSNYYEFFYDVAFPVVIEVRDEDALRGRGYSFLFALEANVMDNKNLLLWHEGKGTFGPYDYSLVSPGLTDYRRPTPEIPDVPGVSENITIEESNLTVKTTVQKLFCEAGQRVSGNITINVKDAVTKSPVGDADISFGCADYAKCYIGTTDAAGNYVGPVPMCIGEGYFEIEKDRYKTQIEHSLSVRPNEKARYKIELHRLQTFIANIKYYISDEFSEPFNFSKIKEYRKSFEEITDNHQVMLAISTVTEHPLETTTNIIIKFEGPESQKITLSPGNHTMFGSFMDMEGFVIPEHTENVSSTEVVVPEISMIPAPLGGVKIDGSNKHWVVEKEDLDNSEITFYVFAASIPETMEELQNIASYEQLSKEYRFIIEPVFS